MNTEETTNTQPEATPPAQPESKVDAGSESHTPQAAVAAEPHAAEPHAAEPPAAEPHAAEPPAAEPHADEPHAAEPHAAQLPAQHAAQQDAVEPGDEQPAAPARTRGGADEYREEPGDDIGNRVRRGGPPDDIGNRLPRGGGAPRDHKPQEKRAPAGGGGRDHGRGAEAKPAAPAAVAVVGGEGSAPAAAVAEGEGSAPGAEAAVVAPGASAAVAAGGDAPAKKRRRRRRRKGPGAGAEGATAGAEGEAAAHADGAEGEEHEGDEHEGAEGEEHEGDEHEAAEGEEAAPGAEGEKPRRRKGPPRIERERPAFSIGEEVFGKVSKVTDSAVWIDIAGKATGLFNRSELIDEEPPVEGDQFIATVASTGVRGGMLMLSRLPLILEETRKVLEAAAASLEPVMGFVTGAVKGGLEVDLGGLRAFAPASHVDLRHGADLNHLVGLRLDFIVTQYAKKGRDVVVSRKRMLEEEGKKARTEALAKIEPGTVHLGIVRKVVAWGVFVSLPDAGGVEGLVHMTEASHDRGARLNDIFKQGAEIEVKVLNVDDKGKLWLSRKAVVADPWDAVKEKYAVGSRHKGKVARLQPFGAFIELETGIDGLIHTGDLSIKPGDEIEVIVASCDPGAHKIGLHPAPPPGEEAEARQKVAPHKIVKVAVASVTEGGLVVRVLGTTGRASRGFIPAGHTGTPRGSDLRKDFPIGTQFDAKVLEIDPRRGEAKLSIRAVKEDAEKHAYQQYRAGVARDAKFGTFADLMKKGT
jgi:small subunit ribosomal protein S1